MLKTTLGLFLLCGTALAGSDAKRLSERLHHIFPSSEISHVQRAQALRLWQAFIDGQIVYFDGGMRFFFSGSIYQANGMHNLTDASLAELRAGAFSALPLNRSMIRVKGDGRRKFAIFEDPFCGYCKALEPELDSLTDYTAYVFPYPILGDRSVETAIAAWCSAEPQHVWRTALLNRQPITPVSICDNPVKEVLALGKRLGITGTPTLLFPDGTRHEGLIHASGLSARLDQASSKSPVAAEGADR